MRMATLKEMFIEQLTDAYAAENQIIEALPKLARAAKDEELKQAFQHHLEETRGHVERLDRIFSDLGESPDKRKTCKGMKGLLEEGDEAIEEHSGSPSRDALLIGGAQKVEHYEIALYGTLRAWAEELELDGIAELLDENLDEEISADEKLTSIAEGGLVESGINEEATAGR
jgi:ferritin-like metal-binding protein YciE